MNDDDDVSWLRTPYRAPVLDAAGSPIGTAESLLGDEQEDIFHGIVVKLHEGGALRVVPASATTRITRTTIQTSVPSGQASALEPYHEERWYHLGWGGLFRKHPEWKGGE